MSKKNSIFAADLRKVKGRSTKDGCTMHEGFTKGRKEEGKVKVKGGRVKNQILTI